MATDSNSTPPVARGELTLDECAALIRRATGGIESYDNNRLVTTIQDYLNRYYTYCGRVAMQRRHAEFAKAPGENLNPVPHE